MIAVIAYSIRDVERWAWENRVDRRDWFPLITTDPRSEFRIRGRRDGQYVVLERSDQGRYCARLLAPLERYGFTPWTAT